MSLKTCFIAKLIFLVLAVVYTAEEKAKCVEWYIEEGKIFKQFGVRYRREHGRHAGVPDKKRIWDWYNKFKGQRSVERKKGANKKVWLESSDALSVVSLFSGFKQKQKQLRWSTSSRSCLTQDAPDLTPCDFFLWGWIKSRVYTTPIAWPNFEQEFSVLSQAFRKNDQ